jgi:hypothetical protein
MTKLNVVLKLEGDWITWIDVAQQAIEAAKHVMEETQQKTFEFAYAANTGAHLPGQQGRVA